MSKSKKIGVNDDCPCGAKKANGYPVKYKKCCRKKQRISEEEIIKIMGEKFLKQEKERFALREKGIFINYVKPVVFTNPTTGKTSKVWGLGNQVIAGHQDRTFHDFILYYLQDTLGKDWMFEQANAMEKHFIYQCFVKFEQWRSKSADNIENRVDDKTWYAITDGWTKTLVSLAFDIVSLQHTRQLPEHLLKRLKSVDEYQGAHYEIAIAAIFARLDCRIEFLDDKDRLEKHCEFIATHLQTNVQIAVEAKSRHRRGVKHTRGVTEEKELVKGDVTRLFNRALKQNPKDKPFFIFIDINCPLTPGIEISDKQWFKDINKIFVAHGTPTAEKPDEYTGVIFTNFSPHYQGEKESGSNEFLAVIPLYSVFPLPNEDFRNMLLNAVQSYGFVPNVSED